MPAESAAALPEVARRLVRATFGERATEPVPLASGAWSQAFALAVDGAEVVLRIGAYGTDFAKDEVVAGLAGSGLPVPAVVARGMVEGWHYAISARAHGIGFDDLSAGDVAQALPRLLAAIDDIGRIDLAGTTGYGIWAADRRAPYRSWVDALLAIGTETARVPGWRAALAGSEIGLEPVEAGLAAIGTLAPYLPAERRMIHGDLLSGNVLVAGGNVSAVLDWGNAMYGDSLYDAAWLIYWWPWYPDWRPIDINAALLAHWRANGPLPINLRERLHAYLIHIGLDAIAYCTFQRRWDEVRTNAETVVALTKRAPGEIGLE
ncbi:aminoglycoside phosphotransferase family protein [Kribbella pittospori]|uniref:Aminoglycoside phosphotransferase family protein n=1 Tax=Kribbella pittospori TaxID=722689 RepID=A0A4R0KFN9_9ACTN|nr:phosphotransferase [Kribbella pittospori]TCC58650.1 aminoglycoside phosphotransferase family protein [Kribbella pittospori]